MAFTTPALTSDLYAPESFFGPYLEEPVTPDEIAKFNLTTPEGKVVEDPLLQLMRNVVYKHYSAEVQPEIENACFKDAKHSRDLTELKAMIKERYEEPFLKKLSWIYFFIEEQKAAPRKLSTSDLPVINRVIEYLVRDQENEEPSAGLDKQIIKDLRRILPLHAHGCLTSDIQVFSNKLLLQILLIIQDWMTKDFMQSSLDTFLFALKTTFYHCLHPQYDSARDVINTMYEEIYHDVFYAIIFMSGYSLKLHSESDDRLRTQFNNLIKVVEWFNRVSPAAFREKWEWDGDRIKKSDTNIKQLLTLVKGGLFSSESLARLAKFALPLAQYKQTGTATATDSYHPFDTDKLEKAVTALIQQHYQRYLFESVSTDATLAFVRQRIPFELIMAANPHQKEAIGKMLAAIGVAIEVLVYPHGRPAPVIELPLPL